MNSIDNPPQNNVVLTEPEVRRSLRLSKATLIRMRQRPDRGGLPFVQLSAGRIGYLDSDVRAFLAARRVGATEELKGVAA